MNPAPVIAACRKLFRIQPFLASGIIPSLRMEDIKIALAKQLHAATTLKSREPSSSPQVQECLNSYNILADYIRRYNLEVMLALKSHTDTDNENSSYLFPATDSDKTKTDQLSSLSSRKDLFFSGTLPPRKLRLSSYLYYKGIISYYNVIESIAWQKDRRPLIGQMAMQIGKLTAEEFAQIIVHVKNGECFGTVAKNYKFLSQPVISALVKAQEKYDCRIGRYFVEKKLLTEPDLQKYEEDMRSHNYKFGTSL